MRAYLILLLGLPHFAKAQPAVLYSSMPQTATTYIMMHGDAEYSSEFISLGSSWSVSAEALATPGTAYWGPSGGSAYDDEFPNANWLLKTPNGSTNRYRYYIVNSGGIRLAGEVIFGNTTTYSIPRSILFFPMYLDYESFGGYQIQGQPVASFSYSYSSYGTLSLGQHTFSNVIQIYGNDDVTYWNADPLYPIVMLDTRDWPYDWIALLPGQVSIEDLGERTWSFAPYPNPSTGTIHVDRHTSEVSYAVTDMLGKVVLTGTRTNDVIDLSSLQAGSYQVLLNGPGSTRSVPVMKTD